MMNDDNDSDERAQREALEYWVMAALVGAAWIKGLIAGVGYLFQAISHGRLI